MSRCLLASNRLPIAFDSLYKTFVPSSGGLVSAIKGLDSEKLGYHFEWMGILTDDIDANLILQLSSSGPASFCCHPVIVSRKIYDEYYNSYCNNVLWPLFHYERNMVRHNENGWPAYVAINQLMAQAILQEAKEDDIIWVHDFHLLLVPGLIKDKRPELKVSFFLHIPFPSSEIFRELPQRKDIIHSLLKADHLGFHDLSYLNHFRSSVQRVVGEIPPLETTWGVYPISIDGNHFLQLSKLEETKNFINRYKKTKSKMRWILGVDRLDYTKGLLLKLRAYRSFLGRFPEEREKVQLVQVVIPSRTEVVEYKKLKDEIEKLVSRINGEFGSLSWMPIQYIFHSVSEHELSALYQLSEVLLVGSRRDGMNLVSLEYVMSQTHEYPGVVILSEFAGASSTLSYAMSINPWNIQDTAQKIHEALHHPEPKRRMEMLAMKEFLKTYSSSEWASLILRDLRQSQKGHKALIQPAKDGFFDWMKALRDKQIMFFCDLDGTLAPLTSHPKDVRLQAQTLELLSAFANLPHCEFVIVSGRDKEFLEEQFLDQDFNFALAACHGAYAFSPRDRRWHNLIPHDSTRWKENAREILHLYTIRTPGSFIEDKGHGITWHYRNSPKEFADFLASKLVFELEEALNNFPVDITRGKKIIEIKSIHANKGYFIQHWLQGARRRPEVVIALGDDVTDEDMFQAIQDRVEFRPYCIKVGQEKSVANYFIKDQSSVNLFLRNFLGAIRPQL
jgi:trehalose 6-phosphate synthase/phosphatase